MVRTSRDWILFTILVFLYGSAFLFIELSVQDIPPLTVVAGRLTLGAVFVWAWMRHQGHRLPPLYSVENGNTLPIAPAWIYFFLLALVGNVIPFFLISWGQVTIDSSLAGILMAIMPLATMMLAHFLVPGEPLTAAKIGGFVLGFLGIVILMGPATLGSFSAQGPRLVAELAVLGGALCYAANSIIARHAPRHPPIMSSAGILLIGAVMSVALALWIDRPWTLTPDFLPLFAVLFLGVFTTAVATVVYMELIQTAGPSFFALTNYLVPILAVFLGVLFLNEPLEWRAIAALGLVLIGIFLSQSQATRVWISQRLSSPSK